MRSGKKAWALLSVFNLRDRIDTNPDYQRPPVWTRSQKQLLMDTVLRDYDIPKVYLRHTGEKPDIYEVVDGQQRIRAICEYFEGKFKLPKDADPVDGESIADCGYDDLSVDARLQLDNYNLDMVVIEKADEDEVREMFLRLQNGTTLRAQEKRNAYRGRMRDFVKELASHSFFDAVGFRNSRYTYDLVCAQLVCLELSRGPTNVKNADLNKMYKDQVDFDSKSGVAKSVRSTLDLLAKVFPDKTPELTRYNVVSLYCVLAELLNAFVRTEFSPLIYDWFIEFEQHRQEQGKLAADEADPVPPPDLEVQAAKDRPAGVVAEGGLFQADQDSRRPGGLGKGEGS